MENQIQIVDPSEFGIEQQKATSIESAFKPKLVEREAFTELYSQVIKQELTPETFKQARELRLKLVKVRTGISDIHKVEKAFYLASGKYVDALKNKLTAPIEQMEEKLMEIEKYEEMLEAERKAKLKQERIDLLSPYGTDVTFIALDAMGQDQFDQLLEREKFAYKARLEAEAKAERERIEAEKKAEEERAERERLEKERIEAQRVENERLKKEAEEKEKQLAAERKKQKEEQDRKDAEAKTEAERLAKIAAEEKDKAEKLAAKLKAKEDAERIAQEEEKARIEAEEADRLAKEKALLLAPDQEKVKVFFAKFDVVSKSFPELSSEPGIAMSKRVNEALAMVRKLIIDDSKTLL